MSSLDELERELGPRLRAAYRDQLAASQPDIEPEVSDERAGRRSSRRSLTVASIAAALVPLLAGGLMWTGRRDEGRTATSTVADSVPSAATAPTPSPTTTGPVTTTPTPSTSNDSTPGAAGRLTRTLTDGASGPDVEMVQERLADLGFFVGPADGVFGALSMQAVWAYEKLVLGTPRDEATGVVNAEMWEHMSGDIQIEPRRPTDGRHVEIYLPEQVMVVFHDDRAVAIVHVSTGELIDGADAFTPWYDVAAEYCETVTIDIDTVGTPLGEAVEKALCGRSYTPPGVFVVERIVEGQHRGPLGGMRNPVYINQGIAIHGALNVPLQPASHGTIRVNQLFSDSLPELIGVGDPVMIWDGVTDPWDQPPEVEQMRFDYPDPNATAIAEIDIPAIDVELFVVPLNEPDDMKQGPAWNPGSDSIGSGGIIHIVGHRTTYGAPFFDLDQLVADDSIELRSARGQSETYVVQSNTVVDNDAPLPALAEPALVLDTQEPKYTQRSTRRVVAVQTGSSGEAG